MSDLDDYLKDKGIITPETTPDVWERLLELGIVHRLSAAEKAQKAGAMARLWAQIAADHPSERFRLPPLDDVYVREAPHE